MKKQALTGTLEEQCEFLYNIAIEKLEQGNYTGAYHALKEVVHHKPDFRDAAQRLAEAKQKKSEQRLLLLSAIVGGILFTGIGTSLQISNRILFYGLILLGVVVGYSCALWWVGNRNRQMA
jgi:hypothetical protein